MEPEPSSTAAPLSDAALIARVRAGDQEAYGALYERHSQAALRLARQLVRGPADADDVVADTFERVLGAIRRGSGPVSAFRPYLLTVIRRAAADQHRGRRPEVSIAAEDLPDPAGLSEDPAISALERSLIARAFRSLPERWTAVLWHREVEGASPAEVALILGLTPNGVAALHYRAREGLRRAYLQLHLSSVTREACKAVAGNLAAYVRGTLSARDSRAVREHLKGCGECRLAYDELASINSSLRGLLAPVILGGAASAYLSGLGGAAAAHGAAAQGAVAAQGALGAKSALGAKGAIAALTRWVKSSAWHRLAAISTAGAVVAAIFLAGPLLNIRHGPALNGHHGSPGAIAPIGGGTRSPTASRSGTSPGISPLAMATPTGQAPHPSAPGTATPAAPAADLNVAVSLNGPLGLGLVATVVVRVSNVGAGSTAGLTAQITLPPGLSLLGLTANAQGWTCQTGSAAATCWHAALAPGAAASASLQALVVSLAGCGTPIVATVTSAALSASGQSGSRVLCL